MTVFLFFVGILQCFIIWALGQAGIGLGARAQKERDMAGEMPPGGWPPCAMIIPASGQNPGMETALRSLIEQDYRDFFVFLVTGVQNDPAEVLIEQLCEDYNNVRHIIAGQSEKGGQKNRNLLAGVQAAGQDFSVYVFCDSTHVARPDFLRCLLAPIARGEAAFSTGYHQVEPRDDAIIGLAYAQDVMCMRFLQGMAVLTQPWGGAMAMSADAFRRYNVADLWRDNVVDDCSLAAWLAKKGVHVRLCAGALLQTFVQRHVFAVWRAWLERQVLFLKFCMPGQWLGLGLFSLVMVVPPIWFFVEIGRGILGLGGGMGPFLALCWCCLIAWAIGGWRRFLPNGAGLTRWLWAFFCSCAVFAMVFATSIFTRSLLWHNTVYHVGKGGVVRSLRRH